jgi:hypothetical protein
MRMSRRWGWLLSLVVVLAGVPTGTTVAAAVEPAAAVASVPWVPGMYAAVTPTRLLDTRKTAAVAPGASVAVTVLGTADIPRSGVAAVAVNITAVDPTRYGNLTASATGSQLPTTSALNFVAGQTVANAAVVAVGSGGRISVTNSSRGRTQIVVDVLGYVVGDGSSAPGALGTVSPIRLLDTRRSSAVTAGGVVSVQVAGRNGVPAGATAAVVNLTAVAPTRFGDLSAVAAGTNPPPTSTVNFVAGQTVANAAVVPLSASGALTVFNQSLGRTHVLVDLVGFVQAGSGLRTPSAAGSTGIVTPARLLDTRHGVGAPQASIPFTGSVAVPVAGRAGIPAGVSSVVANVTVAAPAVAGHVVAYADGAAAPGTSTVNFAAGQTVANQARIPVGADGAIRLRNDARGNVDLILDVTGYTLAADRIPIGRSVYSWGTGASGELGTGSLTATGTPAQLPGLTAVSGLAVRGSTAYAVELDGSGWAWGANDAGQLGDPANGAARSTAPVRIPGLTQVAAVAAADRAGYALLANRTVVAWGDNSAGQLGRNTVGGSSSAPAAVTGLTDVLSITAGSATGYAVRSDGTVWAWGDNSYGQTGLVPGQPVSRPRQVAGLPRPAVAVAATAFSAFVLLDDGSVWALGANSWGELGPGGTLGAPSATPVKITGLPAAVRIAAGYISGYAIAADGSVRAWGGNDRGELGNGRTASVQSNPGMVSLASGTAAGRITGVSSGALTVDRTGRILGWGDPTGGVLGDGRITGSPVLTPVLTTGGNTGWIDVVGAAAGEPGVSFGLSENAVTR